MCGQVATPGYLQKKENSVGPTSGLGVNDRRQEKLSWLDSIVGTVETGLL